MFVCLGLGRGCICVCVCVEGRGGEGERWQQKGLLMIQFDSKNCCGQDINPYHCRSDAQGNSRISTIYIPFCFCPIIIATGGLK